MILSSVSYLIFSHVLLSLFRINWFSFNINKFLYALLILQCAKMFYFPYYYWCFDSFFFVLISPFVSIILLLESFSIDFLKVFYTEIWVVSRTMVSILSCNTKCWHRDSIDSTSNSHFPLSLFFLSFWHHLNVATYQWYYRMVFVSNFFQLCDKI